LSSLAYILANLLYGFYQGALFGVIKESKYNKKIFLALTIIIAVFCIAVPVELLAEELSADLFGFAIRAVGMIFGVPFGCTVYEEFVEG